MDEFKLAEECSKFIEPIDLQLAQKLKRCQYAEAMLPHIQSALNKVGRKNHFDPLKISKEDYNKLIDLYVLVLEKKLQYAKLMKEKL